MNLERFIAYYSVSGGDDTNVGVPTSTRVKESKFNMQDNPILVDEYGTYREYMKSMMLRYPYSKDAIIDKNGKENTRILGSVMFTDHDGTQKPAYPACYEALNYGVEAEEETSFEKSNWWLSSADEMNTLMKDVTVGISGLETDDMNKGIADALGFRISATDICGLQPSVRATLVALLAGMGGLVLQHKTIAIGLGRSQLFLYFFLNTFFFKL